MTLILFFIQLFINNSVYFQFFYYSCECIKFVLFPQKSPSLFTVRKMQNFCNANKHLSSFHCTFKGTHTHKHQEYRDFFSNTFLLYFYSLRHHHLYTRKFLSATRIFIRSVYTNCSFFFGINFVALTL